MRLLEELELAQKRESQQLQEELRQRSGDAEVKRARAASEIEVAAEKIRILEAEVSSVAYWRHQRPNASLGRPLWPLRVSSRNLGTPYTRSLWQLAGKRWLIRI